MARQMQRSKGRIYLCENKECKDWDHGVRTINRVILLAQVHQIKVAIKTFDYCPWCGTKTTEIVESRGGKDGDRQVHATPEQDAQDQDGQASGGNS